MLVTSPVKSQYYNKMHSERAERSTCNHFLKDFYFTCNTIVMHQKAEVKCNGNAITLEEIT